VTHTPMRPNAGSTRIKLVVLGVLLALISVGCSKTETEQGVDVSAWRVACEKESGFSGDSMLVPETGTIFVWRADGEEVAECHGHNSHVHLLGVLNSGQHPADLK
jgi:hypothetical protein